MAKEPDTGRSGPLILRGLRVVEGEKGLFVTMPQRKDGQGNYRDVAHPVTPEMRAVLSSAVLEGYPQAMERGERQAFLGTLGDRGSQEGAHGRVMRQPGT